MVSSRDCFLNAIHQGGASLVPILRTFSAAETGGVPKETTIMAQDRGNGSYSMDCSLKQACDFEVSPLTNIQTLCESKFCATSLLATLRMCSAAETGGAPNRQTWKRINVAMSLRLWTAAPSRSVNSIP